jgi:hypothetical protein
MKTLWTSPLTGIFLLLAGIGITVESRLFNIERGRGWDSFQPGMAIAGALLALFVFWIWSARP